MEELERLVREHEIRRKKVAELTRKIRLTSDFLHEHLLRRVGEIQRSIKEAKSAPEKAFKAIEGIERALEELLPRMKEIGVDTSEGENALRYAKEFKKSGSVDHATQAIAAWTKQIVKVFELQERLLVEREKILRELSQIEEEYNKRLGQSLANKKIVVTFRGEHVKKGTHRVLRALPEWKLALLHGEVVDPETIREIGQKHKVDELIENLGIYVKSLSEYKNLKQEVGKILRKDPKLVEYIENKENKYVRKLYNLSGVDAQTFLAGLWRYFMFRRYFREKGVVKAVSTNFEYILSKLRKIVRRNAWATSKKVMGKTAIVIPALSVEERKFLEEIAEKFPDLVQKIKEKGLERYVIFLQTEPLTNGNETSKIKRAIREEQRPISNDKSMYKVFHRLAEILDFALDSKIRISYDSDMGMFKLKILKETHNTKFLKSADLAKELDRAMRELGVSGRKIMAVHGDVVYFSPEVIMALARCSSRLSNIVERLLDEAAKKRSRKRKR